MNCFRQNTRPNLARIIFIEIVDLVRDRHLEGKIHLIQWYGEWVRNNDLPQGVLPADTEDAPQAPFAPPPPQAFSLDPLMQYLDGKFASLVTHMDEQFATVNTRLQALETRQSSMDLTLNAFRGEWRGHNLGPHVEDEDEEDEENDDNEDMP
ncbi:hypothetical protein V6N13_140036 [Hibiscus sabdariffa]